MINPDDKIQYFIKLVYLFPKNKGLAFKVMHIDD
jgi:hypothetical protein